MLRDERHLAILILISAEAGKIPAAHACRPSRDSLVRALANCHYKMFKQEQ